MNIVVITPPAYEPVTLQDCYSHLRLTPLGSPPTHPDDAMLLRNISSARKTVEQSIRRAIIFQTIRIGLATFPRCSAYRDYIELKNPEFRSLVSFRYYDSNGAQQTLDPSLYYVDILSSVVPRIEFNNSYSFPIHSCRSDAIQITWNAGYKPGTVTDGLPPTTQAQATENVPKNLIDAVLIGVQLLYDELSPDKREALEKAQESLMVSERVHSF